MNQTATANTEASPRRSQSRSEILPKKPLRVVHVVHWPVSGIVSLLKNLIPRMPHDAIESHIIFFYEDAATLKDFAQICASAHSLNLSHSYIGGLLSYRRLLKTLAPDIVHFHSFQPMVWGTFFGSGSKRVCTVHSSYPYFQETTLRARVKRAIQKAIFHMSVITVVAVSRRVHDALAGFDISSGRLHVIENGIPLMDQTPSPAELDQAGKEINRGDNDIVCVTLGRMDRLKGYPHLLQAFQRLLKTRSNLLLLFIGDGPEKDRLAAMAEALGIDGHVRFLGFKKKPAPYLSISDIYICSSIVEGWALAVAEAMFSGLPAIATRVGAIPDFIENGVSGLLVEPGDSAGLAAAMEALIVRRNDWPEMGRSARTAMIKNYDIQKTADAYAALYAAVDGGAAA